MVSKAVADTYNSKSINEIVKLAASGICGNFNPAVLARLRLDPGGKVSAAFNAIKPDRPGILIFYAAQAADLAISRENVVRHTSARAKWFSEQAKITAGLAIEFDGEVPIEYRNSLRSLSQWMAEQSEIYQKKPDVLQISRKASVENAAAILALRHLRYNVYGHDARGNVNALVDLVSAALGVDIQANSMNKMPGWVSEALRRPRISKGVSKQKKSTRMTKSKISS